MAEVTQLTIDGREERLDVREYTPPLPQREPCPVIPMWYARQHLHGVKATRDVQYESPPEGTGSF